MRNLLSLLLLFSTAVHADQNDSKQECHNMYQAIALDIEISHLPSRQTMSYYLETCVYNDKSDSTHTSMAKAVLSNEIVSAIKNKLAEQDVVRL